MIFSMKRQAAFIWTKPMLKGGLHCHTTRSDGEMDPAAVVRLHKENGYDFLAITDHRRYNYDNFGVEGVTIVPGMEMDGNFLKPEGDRQVHCHHIVCIGPQKDKGNGYEQDQQFERWSIKNPEDSQPYLDEIHRNGNLTIYAHPQWSGTPISEFEMLTGNFAMEIWNSGSAMENRKDMDAAYWDELLFKGKRIYGVATDDGHEEAHHCHGYVRVAAENRVSDILEALRNGAFYASCGPEIYDFTVEHGVAQIQCSPVSEIRFIHFRSPYRVLCAGEHAPLTEGVMQLRPGSNYVRACVIDEKGRFAWTNPIFLDEEDFA